MPELPEVAYQKKYVDATALHKKVVKMDFGAKKLFQSPQKDFENAVLNKKISATQQLGKYLFLKITSGKELVLHFGMSGKMEFYQHDEVPKHSQLTLFFEDNSRLSFVCPRKFGKIYLAEGIEDFQKKHSLGNHALDIEEEEFMELLQDKTGSIKSALTDQHVIAGIGNLYADEILFQCKIHPKTSTAKLSDKEIKCLFEKMGKILKRVIKSKTGDSKLPESYLTRHRKEGADCPDCKGKVEMIKVSGRSTYFCPDCQAEK
ncbi:DNA-formamidopyrimidine glycosylase family protein [Salegentibacter sp. F188]|uniref:DNA-formamidopyrimidine glycosylase family protein n=1 Tax=Autumnicola patrickiae TaxID=3075591 RepID=A0ABU3E123_9FLAO|nr:DNA-formamidopyrimidine glycosylase family protein [Salegentibacter sp. F188]MDT0689690.1 DNA-formamidopyrimidine glycosylase family protein [Salegentibacter sp. F188]